MRRDHRPYLLKKLDQRIQHFYAKRFLRPQFDRLGRGGIFIKPWYVEVFGPRVSLGDFPTVVGAPDARIRLSVWPRQEGEGKIVIGDYALLCPGVRISSAAEVRIEDNCMIASHAYITDSDWHGIYDRVSPGQGKPVHIEENVWIGDSAILCKGVHVGKNSIIGAGAVVAHDIPENVIAAGNPAEVIRELDRAAQFKKRAEWYADPGKLFSDLDAIDREMLRQNTLFGWLRHLVSPRQRD